MDGLNHRQELFLAAYLEGEHQGNATAAAAAVGYKKPNVQGPRLLVNVGIVARIAAHEQALREAILAEGIANKQFRIDLLNDLAGRLQRTIAARAKDPSVAAIPGGPEGVLVRTAKLVKVYTATGPVGGDALHPEREPQDEVLYPEKESRLVADYAVDTGTLAELRAMLKQAAIERGEWSERSEITGKDGGEIVIRRFIGVEVDTV